MEPRTLVRERQLLGVAFDELTAPASAARGPRRASRAPGRGRRRVQPLRRTSSRATSSVPVATSRTVPRSGFDARDEEPPPARILAEREERGVAVVRRPSGARGPSRAPVRHEASLCWRVAAERRARPARRAPTPSPAPGEELAAVIPADPRAASGLPLLVQAGGGESAAGSQLDAGAPPMGCRSLVRDAVSLAAMCEVAEETAAGGDLDACSRAPHRCG